MARLFSLRVCIAACALAAFFLSVSAAWAVEINGVQVATADDTPLINIALYRPTNTVVPISGTVVDPTFEDVSSINIQAYFDTGASGILLSKETAASFGVATNPGVTFADIGVGGSEWFDVSEQLYVGVAPYYLNAPTELVTAYNHTFGSPSGGALRTQVCQNEGGYDVVGMPAMAGKVVVIDPKPLDATMQAYIDVINGTLDPDDIVDLEGLRTYVYNPATAITPIQDINPGIPKTSHHVKLSYGDLKNYTIVDPADPTGTEGPTLYNNPFIGPNPVVNDPNDKTPGVTVSMGGLSATGSYLLDTGAQASMISTQTAAKLHIRYTPGTEGSIDPQLETYDPNNELAPGTPLLTQFQLTLGGIGGQTTVAGFYLDSLVLPTVEAANSLNPDDNISFSSAPVLICDIGLTDYVGTSDFTLDGIFGMNYLMASMATDLSAIQLGSFNWVVIDEPGKLLGLDVASVPEPSTLVLLVTGVLMLWWRRASGRRLAAR